MPAARTTAEALATRVLLKCSGGNAASEYLTIKNYSRTATVNLKGYVVKDATGNKFTFTKSHTLQRRRPPPRPL